MIVPVTKSAVHIPLLVKNGSGALVNADSTPTILSAQKNGSAIATTGITVSQAQDQVPANITGAYIVDVDLSGSGVDASENDDFILIVQATISSTTLTQTLSFTVAAMTGSNPSIEFG